MKQTVSNCDFHDSFRNMDRLENFSYEGRNILFDYLEQYEECTGEEIELDVIALCCEFQESTLDEVINDYQIDVEGYDGDQKRDAVIDYLEDNTMLVGEPSEGVFIFQCF